MLGDIHFLEKLSPECKPSPEAVKEAGKLMEPYNEASLKAKSSAICGIYKWVCTMLKIQYLDTNILSFNMRFFSHSTENSKAVDRYLTLFVEYAGFEHNNFCYSYIFFCLLQHAFFKYRSLK